MTPYDALASRFLMEYSLFLSGVVGRYQRMRSTGVQVTPRVISDLIYDVVGFSKTLYGVAVTEFDNYLAPLVADAPDALRGALLQREQNALGLLRNILVENVAQVAKMCRSGRGDVTSMLKNEHGALGLLVQSAAGRIEFKAHDTAGRKWSAPQLLRVIVRDFAYQTFIDHQAEQFLQSGVDLVEVNGKVFSLLASDEYPTLIDVRQNLFHPNSSAVMVPHVQP